MGEQLCIDFTKDESYFDLKRPEYLEKHVNFIRFVIVYKITKERLTELFNEWKPMLLLWQKFQDENKNIGNCYYWWHSRFCEDFTSVNKGMFVRENYNKQLLFPFIWDLHYREIQRINSSLCA